MFEPKCDWWRKIKWEDKTVLLKGILSIKRKDYGRFVELALDAGMREALAGDYDEESQSGEFWFDAEKEGPRGISLFLPPHQGLPRQVGPWGVRMEDRETLRCPCEEGADMRKGILLHHEGQPQRGEPRSHRRHPARAIGSRRGYRHSVAPFPSWHVGRRAACRRYGGYYISTILAL